MKKEQVRTMEKRSDGMYSILTTKVDRMNHEGFKSKSTIEQFCPKKYLEDQVNVVLPEDMQIRKSNIETHKENIAKAEKGFGPILRTKTYQKWKANANKYAKIWENEGKLEQIKKIVEKEMVDQEGDVELLEHFKKVLAEY